jgi:hypothetical protein
MIIEIINSEGDEITNLSLESNPFTLGQIIHLEINNRDKRYWVVEEVQKSFLVDKIESYVRVDYQLNGKRNESVSISVEVSEIKTI